jgi:hypothetical protein
MGEDEGCLYAHPRAPPHRLYLCEAPLEDEPFDPPPVARREGAEQVQLAPLTVQLDEAHLVGQQPAAPEQGTRRHLHGA